MIMVANRFNSLRLSCCLLRLCTFFVRYLMIIFSEKDCMLVDMSKNVISVTESSCSDNVDKFEVKKIERYVSSFSNRYN